MYVCGYNTYYVFNMYVCVCCGVYDLLTSCVCVCLLYYLVGSCVVGYQLCIIYVCVCSKQHMSRYVLVGYVCVC